MKKTSKTFIRMHDLKRLGVRKDCDGWRNCRVPQHHRRGREGLTRCMNNTSSSRLKKVRVVISGEETICAILKTRRIPYWTSHSGLNVNSAVFLKAGCIVKLRLHLSKLPQVVCTHCVFRQAEMLMSIEFANEIFWRVKSSYWIKRILPVLSKTWTMWCALRIQL